MTMEEKDMRKNELASMASEERKIHSRHKCSKRRRLKHIGIWLLSAFLVIVFAIVAYLSIQKITAPNHIPKDSVILDPTSLNIIENEQNMENQEETPSEWYLKLVNRWNPIPENYEVNLVEVPGGEKVDERIYEPLMEMLEAAKEKNWDQLPMVVSGYRTQEKQQELYDEKIRKYKRKGYSDDEAIQQAEQWVAIPGYSEHQLGLAVDINGATYDVYQWLQENSYKYGFIFRYPGDKKEITGIAEEVWHYRYVGVEVATEIYNQGICLEEYLENLESERP